MKKFLFYAAAALALTACSSSDNDGGQDSKTIKAKGEMNLYVNIGETTNQAKKVQINGQEATVADIVGNFNIRYQDDNSTNYGTAFTSWTLKNSFGAQTQHMLNNVTSRDKEYAQKYIDNGQLIAWGQPGQVIETHNIANQTYTDANGDEYYMYLGIRKTGSNGSKGKVLKSNDSNGRHYGFNSKAEWYFSLDPKANNGNKAGEPNGVLCETIKYIECPDGAAYIGFDVDGDGDYNDWMQLVCPSVVNGEIETNFSLLDEHTNYTDSVLTTKMSCHIRVKSDVEIKIPVPEDFRSTACQVDDFDIRKGYNMGETAAYNDGEQYEITDPTTGIKVSYKYDNGYIVITTSGVAANLEKGTICKQQSFYDDIQKTYYEFSFEVFARYWTSFANVDAVREACDKATITSLASNPAGDKIWYKNTKVAAGTEVELQVLDDDGNVVSTATDKYGNLKKYTKKYDDFCVTPVANSYKKTMIQEMY